MSQKIIQLLSFKPMSKLAFGTLYEKKLVFFIEGIELAVKMIDKTDLFVRRRVLKEIETFYVCRGQQNIIQVN